MYYMIIIAIHVRSLLVVSLMESHEERILGQMSVTGTLGLKYPLA